MLSCKNSKTVERLRMFSMLHKPWQVIHGDFCGPFLSGDYHLVLMDEHSRFPEIEIIRSTLATVSIERLENIFSFPVEFVSNSGPPFSRHAFYYYLGIGTN